MQIYSTLYSLFCMHVVTSVNVGIYIALVYKVLCV